MPVLSLSLGQIDIRLGDVRANIGKAAEWIEEAAKRGSQMVLLPELFTCGYDLENWKKHASTLDQGVFEQLSQLACAHRIFAGGSMLEKKDGEAYNTFSLFDTAGKMVGAYRKIHLFRLMQEHIWLSAGNLPTIIDTQWGKIGMAICYDLRFPEIFRYYALEGAVLVLLVAEWPVQRIEHWRVLLRARAIENQMFIAAVNRCGESKGEHFGGHSTVIDPWGKTILEANQLETMISTDIDLSQVTQARIQIPIFADRRPELYR